MPSIGEFEQVELHYDAAKQAWTGYWPQPWNPPTGRYFFEAKTAIDPAQWLWELPGKGKKAGEGGASVEPEGEAYATAAMPFDIAGRPRPKMAPGLCVATWEYDFKDRFVGPDGSEGDWRKLFDWCEYIGADTLWFRGAVTDPPVEGLTLEQPFKPIDLRVIPMLGAEAHRRGLKFGVWAVAYATYPRQMTSRKPAYDYSLDVSRSTGATSHTSFISLFDNRRVDALAGFFKQMQETPEVDMVGLDYMRSDRGGYEMVPRFTSEMPLRLPAQWAQWGERRRQQYVAQKVEGEWQTDPNFYDAWNWWRAHFDADIVHQIITKSGVQKPTWIFVLSWWHGMQHGQDPLMFTDAGITMLAPMLYQVPNRGHFDMMVKDWGGYLRAGQVNLVPGDQVDFYWHQKLTNPPAPAEMYDRIVTAHEKYIPGGTVGAFWHDINRAANPGNLGPYSGHEWALAGAAAFSRVRDTWKVYPLSVQLEAPDAASIGATFTAKVKVKSLVNRDVSNVRVAVCDTPLMQARGLTTPQGGGEPFAAVKAIGPQQAVEVPIQARVTQASSARGNRAMLALRITWDEGQFDAPVRTDLPRQIVVMKYIKGQ